MATKGLILLQGLQLSCDLRAGYRGFFFFLADVVKTSGPSLVNPPEQKLV